MSQFDKLPKYNTWQHPPSAQARPEAAKKYTNQHVQRSLVRKARDQRCNEWVSSNRGKHIAFVANMFDLLQLDDCTAQFKCSVRALACWRIPSIFFSTFNANT